jgi:flagellum-specific peptidoglycan hydrolase FlgJ
MTEQQKKFLQRIVPLALQCERRANLPPAVTVLTIAQAILESSTKAGWGTSQLFRLANNPFGIKVKSRSLAGAQDDSVVGWVEMPTTEIVNGIEQKVRARFRAFKSLDEAFVAHGELLTSPRYKAVAGAKDPCEAAKLIQQCGYATDPNYAMKLWNLILEFDLNNRDMLLALGTSSGNVPLTGGSPGSPAEASDGGTVANTKETSAA